MTGSSGGAWSDWFDRAIYARSGNYTNAELNSARQDFVAICQAIGPLNERVAGDVLERVFDRVHFCAEAVQ